MSARITAGAIVLTPQDARLLYASLDVGNRRKSLRDQHNPRARALYELLTEISVCAFTETDAAVGTLPMPQPAPSEAGFMTVAQLAKASRLAPRTIRVACQRNEIPATKAAGAWVIPTDTAAAFIASHTRSTQ